LIRSDEMSSDQNSSRDIEDTLLLQFLIARYAEMLQQAEPNLVPVWAGLGLVALHKNGELRNAFKILIESDSYTIEEVLTSSIDLFLAELHRLESADTIDCAEKNIERRPLTQRTARRFLIWCWGEGRKMKREQEFTFYAVWELLSWLAFTSDKYLSGFEEMCRFSDDPIEVRLRGGLEVIKAAIFRRDIGSTSFEQHMLKTGTTPNDKETTT
jgi:hypothetical protein